MTTTDYNQIRYQDGNPLLPQFDHIRLVIDPMFLQCQTSGADTGAIGPNAPMALLSQVVSRALDSGLAVIIDFHPYIVSELHYEGVKPANATVATWSSMMKRDYVCAENGLPGDHFPIVSDSHPLVKFWNSFSIAIAGEIAAGRLPSDAASKVYLEIMNEPMADFNSNRFSDIVSLADYPGARGVWEANWRTLQKKAIEKVHQNLPAFKTIACSYTSLPQDLVGWAENTADTTGTRSHYGPPYSYSELSSMGTVYYAVHFYDPFRFTSYDNRNNWINGSGVWKWRIAGDPIQDNDPKYDVTRDFTGTYNGSLNIAEYMTGEPPEIDEANWWLLDRNMSSMLLAVDTWKASQAPPPPRTPIQPVGIIFTEFGANKRPLNPEPQSDPGADPFADRFGDPFRIDRAQWYYDARTNFETRGYSWTGFEYVGSKGLWEAVRFHENLQGVGPIHGHTDRLNINSTMHQALFGSTRP